MSDSPLRICLLTPEFPPERVGGIGAYVAALAAGLGSRGHRVDVIGCDIHPRTRQREYNWGRSISVRPERTLTSSMARFLEHAVRHLVMHDFPGFWKLHPLTSARREFAAALALRRFVIANSRQFDVIEYSNWSGEAAWLPTPCPHVAYVARLSTSAADTGGSWVPLALETQSVRKAALVIAHSVSMARKGELLYGCPLERTRVIPLGLPDRPLAALPPRNQLQFISVGRAEDRKGTDLLITALAKILPEFPSITFRFVGPGLPEYLAARPALNAIWNSIQSDFPGRVIDLGRVPDIERDRLLGESHWLLVPSRFESFGLVAVEAMRAGTPVIYSTAGGLTDVGGAAPANIAVQPNDVTDLGRAIRVACRLGIDESLARRAEVREVYQRDFREESMIDKTIAAYREVTSRHKELSR